VAERTTVGVIIKVNNKRDFSPDPVLDDENRIDWEKKQKARRQRLADGTPDIQDEDKLATIEQPRSNRKKSRVKRREYVYDEERDRVVMKRKRRRQTDHLRDLDDWDGAY
jgi:hypothetical protein